MHLRAIGRRFKPMNGLFSLNEHSTVSLTASTCVVKFSFYFVILDLVVVIIVGLRFSIHVATALL